MPKTSNSAMAFEPSVAVFDACTLYPFHLRNIIVQVECLQTTRRLMNDALPGATACDTD